MVLRLPRWPVFSACNRSNASAPGTDLLSRSLDYGVLTLGFHGYRIYQPPGAGQY